MTQKVQGTVAPVMAGGLGRRVVLGYTHTSTPQDNHTTDAKRRARVGALTAESSWALQHTVRTPTVHTRAPSVERPWVAHEAHGTKHGL